MTRLLRLSVALLIAVLVFAMVGIPSMEAASHGSYMRTYYTALGKKAIEIHIAGEDLQASGARDYAGVVYSLYTSAARLAVPNQLLSGILNIATKLTSKPAVDRLFLNSDGSIDFTILQVRGNWAWVYAGSVRQPKFFGLPLSWYPIPVHGLAETPVPYFTALDFGVP
jgi:hypothetical protein